MRQRRKADEDDEEFDRPAVSRPWWWRLLLRRPRDTLAFLVLSGATGAIVVNSVYLQHGPHPAPIFAVHPLPVAAVRDSVGTVHHLRASERERSRREAIELPRPRPAEAPATVAAHKDPIARLLDEHSSHRAPAAHQPAAEQAASRSLVRPSRELLAVQRALSEYGYGQLKPTGIYDAETRAAVQRFEHDRKLPVTGELTEAVRHELAALTGRDLD